MQRKILYIIEMLTIGGAEQVLIDTALNLNRTEFLPAVCCLRGPGEYAHKLDGSDVKVFTLDKKKGIDFSIIGKIRAVMREFRPDLVHCHLFTGNFWGRMAAWREGIPSIITEHSVDRWKSTTHRLSDKFLARKTARILAVSAEVKRFYVEEIGINPHLIRVLHNGIDLHRFDANAHATTPDFLSQIPADAPLVGCVGRMTEAKDYPTWVKAFSILREKMPKLFGVIIGGGELEASIRTLVKQLRIEHCLLLPGHVEPTLPALARMQLFMLSSQREGFPMALLEAMSAGVPVVATDVGGVKEIVVNHETGRLVPPGNAELLAHAALELLNDEPRSLTMAQNASLRVRQEFTLQHMVENTEKVYREVLANAG